MAQAYQTPTHLFILLIQVDLLNIIFYETPYTSTMQWD